MPIENSAGVYLITNRCTDKYYIGSACNLRKRWNQHRSDLRKEKHPNQHLQRSANKYGLDALEFEVLCFCLPKDLIYFEQRCIDWYKPEYNMRRLASSMLGYKHSEQTRLNMAKAHLGKPNNWAGRSHSKETRSLMCSVNKLKGNGLIGVAKSETSRQRTAETLKARWQDPEYRERMLSARAIARSQRRGE